MLSQVPYFSRSNIMFLDVQSAYSQQMITNLRMLQCTVQFRLICHPYVTVTCLMKFTFHHLGWKAVTRSKFHQSGLVVSPFWPCLGEICGSDMLLEPKPPF
jgi:hypothetical protein